MTRRPNPGAPRGTGRILYVSDPSSIAVALLPDPVRSDDLRRWVDMLADSGVDMFDQEVYSMCWSEYWRSERIEYDQRQQHKRFIPMLDDGIQPLDVLIDQSHKRSMAFIAGFRVNDTHGYKSLRGGRFPFVGTGIADVIEKHPEWELTDLPEGEPYCSSYALDFSSRGVRDFTSGVMKEVVDRFDVDGLELCYRDFGYFPLGKGPERAHVMTDFVREVRGILDERGTSGGGRLLLGARVFSTLEENLAMGLDVAAWVREGLLDYLSPQDGMFADFNLPFGEFSALTAASECMLYPGLLPFTSQRARIRLKAAPLSSSTCRAYAHSCYQNGADGISLFNHCIVTHNYPYYPQLMQIFHELRDPQEVAAGERHYIYDPLWSGVAGYGLDENAAADSIVLDRGTSGASGKVHLDLYEDVDLVHCIQFLFRGFGLSHNDELEVRFNGHLIEDSVIGRSRRSDTPPENIAGVQATARREESLRETGGRYWACVPEVRVDFVPAPRPELSSRWFMLDLSTVVYGRNTLEITLRKSDPDASGEIVIDEFEVWVRPR